MPYSPIKVANEFLRLARQSEPPIPLSPLKLLKLVYIAHGWSLQLRHEPLVNEQAQAWQYGPVIPSLYYAIKHYRANSIDRDIQGDSDPQILDASAQGLLMAVMQTYGRLSGTQLSGMTHLPGSPWFNAWNTNGRNAIIPNDDIARHYAELATRPVETPEPELVAA